MIRVRNLQAIERGYPMSDRAEVSYWLRGIVPYLQRLPDYLDEIDEGEQRLAAISNAIQDQRKELDKLNTDIARLETDKIKKFEEVQSIVPEANGMARDILEAAKAKTDEIVKTAEELAAKREADADAYVKGKMAVVEKWRSELT